MCSLNLTLDAPHEACREPNFYGENIVWLQGWFDGPTEMVAAELSGSFFQCRYDNGWASPGLVLMALDASAVLERN